MICTTKSFENVDGRDKPGHDEGGNYGVVRDTLAMRQMAMWRSSLFRVARPEGCSGHDAAGIVRKTSPTFFSHLRFVVSSWPALSRPSTFFILGQWQAANFACWQPPTISIGTTLQPNH